LAQRVVDFGALLEAATALALDHVFCRLGTTIRLAGSPAALRARGARGRRETGPRPDALPARGRLVA